LAKLLRLVSATQSRSGDSVAPACKALRELIYFGDGVWFASESMKAIQG